MRIAIGATGHEIADTVAQSLIKEFGNNSHADIFIGYGILRGMAESFSKYQHWFNIDRGYWGANHYDGNYRISYRGTQFKWHEGIPRKPVGVKLEPWRFIDGKILICPPSEHVRQFFNPPAFDLTKFNPDDCIIRFKGADWEIPWDKIKAVITFNSTVGIEAVKRGIPVLSDVNHSAIGSFYGCTDLSTLIENLQNKPDNRIELFEAMEAHQFKLNDTSGLWKLLSHYLSPYSSVSMEGKQSPLTSSRIVSASAPNQSLASRFSNTGN